jgi:hypothetical protein
VADLASGTAPNPQLVVDHNATTNAGSAEHADQRGVLTASAETNLCVDANLNVIAQLNRHTTKSVGQLCRERVGDHPTGKVPGVAQGSGLRIDLTWSTDADTDQVLKVDPGIDDGRLY